MIDRRNFFRMSAGFAALTAFRPSPAWGVELTLGDYEAQLKTAMSALAAKIVAAPSVAELYQHLRASTAVWAPPPQTFSEQFDGSIHLAPRAYGGGFDESASFSYPTVMNGRSLAVTNLPHLIHSVESPAPRTRLNVSEMTELGNKKNGLLWASCGCHMIQLPVSTNERRPATKQEADRFGDWVQGGGAITAGATPGGSLSLQYVRDLCRCDNGQTLIGFGFEEQIPQSNQAEAAVGNQFITHAAFGVTTPA